MAGTKKATKKTGKNTVKPGARGKNVRKVTARRKTATRGRKAA